MTNKQELAAMVTALRAIKAHHRKIRGEAKADRNHYCAICVDINTGRSRVAPCKTVKLATAALLLIDKAE